jgi:MHS family proline/betaine transporter-like MFS transporter
MENAVHREILSFLILSVGLFMRPFGAAIFGPIGDKFGRQKAISISILLMAIPTFCMGLLPNYSQIGVWAPISLVFLRALQGISLGGEYTAAMVHLVEKAPSNRRCFYGSLSDAGSQIGVLLGSQVLVMLHSFFSDGEVYSFGWRIPFFLAVLLVPFAFLVPNDVPSSNA